MAENCGCKVIQTRPESFSNTVYVIDRTACRVPELEQKLANLKHISDNIDGKGTETPQAHTCRNGKMLPYSKFLCSTCGHRAEIGKDYTVRELLQRIDELERRINSRPVSEVDYPLTPTGILRLAGLEATVSRLESLLAERDKLIETIFQDAIVEEGEHDTERCIFCGARGYFNPHPAGPSPTKHFPACVMEQIASHLNEGDKS